MSQVQPRYSVEGMEQILGSMLYMEHIRAWNRDVAPHHWGNRIFITGFSVNGEVQSWVFSEDWFRAELVKMDHSQPNHDPGYVVLLHSQRIPELLSLMESRQDWGGES